MSSFPYTRKEGICHLSPAGTLNKDREEREREREREREGKRILAEG